MYVIWRSTILVSNPYFPKRFLIFIGGVPSHTLVQELVLNSFSMASSSALVSLGIFSIFSFSLESTLISYRTAKLTI